MNNTVVPNIATDLIVTSTAVSAHEALDVTPVPPKETDADAFARLAALKPIDYERVAKEEAKALGIKQTTLDSMVKAVRDADAATKRTPFLEHEPADDPVNPALLFNEIVQIIRTYIVLDSEEADASAIWTVHTYLTDVLDISPILIIDAPERACAKTLLQTLIGRMACRPLPASNASLSALFRAIEHWNPTLLIDEADTFFRDNAELHGIVNAGYKRGGYVLRSEASGDSFEPRMFSVYGAKSIAGIALEKHLPDSTTSRGVIVKMRRKLPQEKVERMRNVDDRVFARLGSQLVRFAMDYAQQVRLAQPHLPSDLSDREQDNWEPLLAIASCAGAEWIQRLTKAALKMSAASEPVAGNANELLADIRDVFAQWLQPRIKTIDLIERLCADGDMGWATYNHGRPMTARQLAKRLDVYGIKPKTVRQPGNKTPKGYELSQFDDAFTRYLKAPTEILAGTPVGDQERASAPTVAATPQQPLNSLDTFDVPSDQACFAVADTEDGCRTPADQNHSTGADF